VKTVKYFKIITLALVLVGFAGISNAQVPPSKPNHPQAMQWHQKMERNGGWDHMRIPNLTDQQKDQIKDIMLKNREAVMPLQNQMREKAAHLRTLSTGDNVDQKAAEAVIDDMGNLRTQIMKKRFDTRQQIRGLLNDEQRVWFDSHAMMVFGRKARGGMHGFNR